MPVVSEYAKPYIRTVATFLFMGAVLVLMSLLDNTFVAQMGLQKMDLYTTVMGTYNIYCFWCIAKVFHHIKAGDEGAESPWFFVMIALLATGFFLLSAADDLKLLLIQQYFTLAIAAYASWNMNRKFAYLFSVLIVALTALWLSGVFIAELQSVKNEIQVLFLSCMVVASGLQLKEVVQKRHNATAMQSFDGSGFLGLLLVGIMWTVWAISYGWMISAVINAANSTLLAIMMALILRAQHTSRAAAA